MRIAELVMALAIACLSLAIMYKAGERPDWSGEARFSNIGFGEDGAPQGGFWPFWVCAIMFLCSIWVFVNGLLGKGRPARAGGPFLDRHGILVLLTVGVPVFLLVLATDYISMYFAMAIFLLYYTLVLGRHGLVLSLALALVLPAWMYLFFDITMTKTLPKGLPFLDDGLYAPLGTALRQAGAVTIGLLFLAGGVILVLAGLFSARRGAAGDDAWKS